MPRSHLLLLPVLLVVVLSAAGCRSTLDAAYYRTMEAFGQEKRDILVNRVEDARESQEDAKEQFASALEEFSALVAFDGGDLEDLYDRLSRDFERSEARAEEVREHIGDVERVAGALFDEWEEELAAYSDPALRRTSAQKLDETRQRYDEMIQVMRRAEDKMDPVLNAFRDQVLFLKHNLNARAIASLETTAAELQSEVATLIEEMEASIDEANRFIDQMQA